MLALWSLPGTPAQTCLEAPSPTATYRAVWAPRPVAWPSGLPGKPTGLAIDPTGSTLFVLSIAGLHRCPIQRAQPGAAITGFGPATLAVANFRQAVPWNGFALRGRTAYAVAFRPSRGNFLYELDLSTGGVQTHPIPGIHERVSTTLGTASWIPGTGNPMGLMLVDWRGGVWDLNATRSANGALQLGSTTQVVNGNPRRAGVFQPLHMAPGEPGFDATQRTLLLPFDGPNGSTEMAVFDCGIGGGTTTWLPAAPRNPGDRFAEGGELGGLTRDPLRGDLLLGMQRIWDGFRLVSTPAFYVLDRNQPARGCAGPPSAGSGRTPYPTLTMQAGSTLSI